MATSEKTFTDKLGRAGRQGSNVVVPTIDEGGMPQLAIVPVDEVIVREPSPFASTLSVRVRVDGENAVYEPEEVLVV